MKKIVATLLICILLLTASGCDMIDNKKNSIGKTGNTVISVYNALVDNFALRKKEGYKLYGVNLVVNSENVGTYTYVYTDKRPDKLSYSDILIVEVNNRTGKIEKFSSPEYEKYKSEPYDMIKTAMPIDPSTFTIDSDVAIKNAAKAHSGAGFIYNYIELDVLYTDGQPFYSIEHISLVNECIYKSLVDVVTGAVVKTSVEDLL